MLAVVDITEHTLNPSIFWIVFFKTFFNLIYLEKLIKILLAPHAFAPGRMNFPDILLKKYGLPRHILFSLFLNDIFLLVVNYKELWLFKLICRIYEFEHYVSCLDEVLHVKRYIYDVNYSVELDLVQVIVDSVIEAGWEILTLKLSSVVWEPTHIPTVIVQSCALILLTIESLSWH